MYNGYIYTYQDFMQEQDKVKAVHRLIEMHKSSNTYRVALDAETYDMQENSTITKFTKKIFSMASLDKKEDIFSSNNRIPSNFFRRLNTQRCTYSLGNGVIFQDKEVKQRLGQDFDNVLYQAGYNALIHGQSFLYWANDRLYTFSVLEFAPILDEHTGALMAGVRFWQLANDRPLMFTLYEIDGYTQCSYHQGQYTQEPKQPYRYKIDKTVDGELISMTGMNYPQFPIVPLYGNRRHTSTLVGMKQAIDSYDIIRSGFANDLQDCAQVYWLVNGYGGSTDEDIAGFLDRLRLHHIASIDDGGDSASVTPYTQTIPYEARMKYLESLKTELYENFGAFEVSKLGTGNIEKTATEIKACYQGMDEEADDFEYQIRLAVRGLLRVIGIEAEPLFKRNRLANENEIVNTVILEAPYLDRKTILNKFPNINTEEIDDIIRAKDAEDADKKESVEDKTESPEIVEVNAE